MRADLSRLVPPWEGAHHLQGGAASGRLSLRIEGRSRRLRSSKPRLGKADAPSIRAMGASGSLPIGITWDSKLRFPAPKAGALVLTETELGGAIRRFAGSLRIYPRAERRSILSALQWSRKLHEGQKRASGEPYIIHPIRTAEILSLAKKRQKFQAKRRAANPKQRFSIYPRLESA